MDQVSDGPNQSLKQELPFSNSPVVPLPLLLQGFVPAINALAWYYEQFQQDYGRAVELWERADALLSPDAALNLGIVHSQGLYPGKAADQVRPPPPLLLMWVSSSCLRGNRLSV